MYIYFQDKEYPVKAMKIATLQKEIQSLKISNQVCGCLVVDNRGISG